MSNAWETTADDIYNVLHRNNRLTGNLDEDVGICEEICDFQIDHDEVEQAALSGGDIDEQTEYAYQSIEEQLGLKK